MRAPALRLCACLALIVGVAWFLTARLIDAKDPGTRSAPTPTSAAGLPAPPPAAPGLRPTPPAPASPPDEVPGDLGRSALGEPCFGAAAVDPERPCRSLRLARTVFPHPDDAAAAQKVAACRRSFDRGLLRICFWGASAQEATRTVALVGSSHASHWRAAMERVVAAKGWRVISLSRAGCPLTAARPDLPGIRRKVECARWNREAMAYLRSHRSITAVFTGAHLGRVLPRPGETAAAARRGGYARAWRRLLRGGVRHIVVLRDTPRLSGRTLACVKVAMSAGARPGDACALDRDYALRPDPMVEAAPRLRGVVQVADLSRFFCDDEVCRPVIGGALVLRDVSHMTTTYSATLGPYLQRTVDDLTRGWRDGRVPGA